MVCEDLGEAAELKAYHCDVSPGFCAALGRFIISDQATMPHEPRERSLHHPAPRQDFKSFGSIRTLYDLHFEFSAQGSDPIGEGGTGVTAIYPEQAQPSKYGQCPQKQGLRSVAFRGAGRGDNDAEQEAECINKDVSFASFNLLGGIITDFPAVRIRFDAL